jgi:hypothetical protein
MVIAMKLDGSTVSERSHTTSILNSVDRSAIRISCGPVTRLYVTMRCIASRNDLV